MAVTTIEQNTEASEPSPEPAPAYPWSRALIWATLAYVLSRGAVIAGAGAFVLGFYLPPRASQAQTAAAHGAAWYTEPAVPEINAWIVVEPDDRKKPPSSSCACTFRWPTCASDVRVTHTPPSCSSTSVCVKPS